MTFDRDITVLVPDEFGGLVACSIIGLTEALTDDGNADLGAVIDQAGFEESTPGLVPSEAELRQLIRRVEALNRTQDVAAFWANLEPEEATSNG